MYWPPTRSCQTGWPVLAVRQERMPCSLIMTRLSPINRGDEREGTALLYFQSTWVLVTSPRPFGGAASNRKPPSEVQINTWPSWYTGGADAFMPPWLIRQSSSPDRGS